MTLSVCMVVRNEAHNLPRALRSIRGIADELVVTDTGSNDDTVAIAEAAGARMSFFRWCDDFAAARNFVIDQASCDWVLLLDADEELLAESVPDLRREIQAPRTLAYWIRRRDLADETTRAYTTVDQLRLLRRRPDMPFIGRCHPHLADRDLEICRRERMQILAGRTTLVHYGYANNTLRSDKLQRAARLLSLELEARPGQWYYEIELACTWLGLKDARGLDLMRDLATRLYALRADRTPPSSRVVMVFEYLLQTSPQDTPGGWTHPELLDAAQRWFPDNAPLIWIQAEHRFRAGQFPRCAALLRRLVEMGRNESYDRRVGFDPRIIGDDAALNLGVCLIRMGKLDEAERTLQPLLDSATQAKSAEANLAQIRSLRGAS